MARKTQEKWLGATTGAFQPVWDAAQQLLVGRDVNNAVGVMLDNVGGFVGRPRAGIADDEVYRRYIRAQISRNRSDGTPESLLKILRLIVFDDGAIYVREERGYAEVTYRIEDIVISEAVGLVIDDIAGGSESDGARVAIEWWGDDEDDMFQMATQTDTDEYSDTQGFGDSNESVADYDPAAVGGALAYVVD